MPRPPVETRKAPTSTFFLNTPRPMFFFDTPDDPGEEENNPLPRQRSVRERMANNNGDHTAVIAELHAENADLNRRLGLARTAANKAKTESAIPEGSLVLGSDDAKLWAAYQKLGKKPDELTKDLGDLTDLRSQFTKQTKRSAMEKAAKASGLDPDVLGTLGIDLEYKTETKKDVDGERQVGLVKVGDAYVDLREHAEKTWPKFRGSLIVDGEESEPEESSEEPRPTGERTWIPQGVTRQQRPARSAAETYIGGAYSMPGKSKT
jgi:hypothetical protein